METRAFRTRNGRELKFSAIGLGTVPIGEVYELLDEKTAIATVEQACESGVRLFDTSPHYGNGIAESRLGAGLRRAPRSDDHRLDQDRPGDGSLRQARAAQPGCVLAGVRRRLRACAAFRLFVRRHDAFGRAILAPHGSERDRHPADPRLRRLDARRPTQGAASRKRWKALIAPWTSCAARRPSAAIGFGINEADTCVKFARAGDFDVAMMAGRYSLLIQNGLAEFLPLALEKKMGVMLAGVFNSGILATGAIPGAKFEYAPAPPEIMERVRRIEAICATHGTSIRRAALHFAMAHPAVVSVVLGAARPEEVAANAADAEQAVPAGPVERSEVGRTSRSIGPHRLVAPRACDPGTPETLPCQSSDEALASTGPCADIGTQRNPATSEATGDIHEQTQDTEGIGRCRTGRRGGPDGPDRIRRRLRRWSRSSRSPAFHGSTRSRKASRRAARISTSTPSMVGPANVDPAQQVKLLEDLIAKKVDVIGLVPLDVKVTRARAQARAGRRHQGHHP